MGGVPAEGLNTLVRELAGSMGIRPPPDCFALRGVADGLRFAFRDFFGRRV